MNNKKEKVTAIGFLIQNLAGVLFVLGLIAVVVSVFLLYGRAVGILSGGLAMILLGLIISYEAANAEGR